MATRNVGNWDQNIAVAWRARRIALRDVTSITGFSAIYGHSLTAPAQTHADQRADIPIITDVGVVVGKDTSTQRITGIIGTLISVVAGAVIGRVDAAAGFFAGIDRAGEAILAVSRNACAGSVYALVLNRAAQAVVAGSGIVNMLTGTVHANSVCAYVAVIATIGC